MRRPAPQIFRGLISSALDHRNVTCDIPESLTLIRNHWQLVWKRQPASTDNALHRMRHELHLRQLPAYTKTTWAPATASALAFRAKKYRKKAAGPDGWTGA